MAFVMSSSFDPTDDPDAVYRQALALHEAGDAAAAAVLYRRLLQIFPDHPHLLGQLGTAELQCGHVEAGAALIGRALELDPDQPEALSNRGSALMSLGRLDEALACLDRAVALKPDFAQALYLRGSVLRQRGRMDAALACFDRVLAVEPRFADVWNERGMVLERLCRPEVALECFERAAALDPDNPGRYLNIGVTLRDLRRQDEALAAFDRAIALDPDYAVAHANRAMLLLMMGEFAEGWRTYEWRWRDPAFTGIAKQFADRRWNGDGPLAGKTLLIFAEQGNGDTIMFCRYAPLAAAQGAHVAMQALPGVMPLLATLKDDIELIEIGRPLPAFDLCCPLLSLPFVLNLPRPETAANIPYLFADPVKREAWRRRLGEKRRRRIGLVWSGNAQQDNDHNRSMALRHLAPLLRLPFAFHCLQKEIRPADAEMLAAFPRLAVHADELHDFADTAALAAEMDLIVAVDTASAHLAGALGLPVWIMLSFAADWRWLTDRRDSPWYPTATLFRQPSLGDWDAVVRDVRVALAERFGPL
jgi:tetratricopeptide (TPR) repeat protein